MEADGDRRSQNMKEFYKYLLILAGSCSAIAATAQDIHLSQFYETPLLRNPALAGIFTGDVRVQAVYRNQWNSVTIPYQTGALSGEIKFPVGQQNDYVTTALQMTYDVAGSSHFQTTQVLPAVNYHKSLSTDRNMYLSIGFMGGVVQRQFDPSKLSFDNQYSGGNYNPGAPSGENFARYNFTYLDAGAGISFSSSIGENINYFLGAAWYHFNHPKVSFFGDKTIELDPKWEFNAGIDAPVGDNVKIIGQFNQLRQGNYLETIGGVLAGYGMQEPDPSGGMSTVMFYGGLFLRWNDAVIPVIKLEMQKYELAFSYDVNISNLNAASKGFGGFELSLSYKGFFSDRNSSLNKLRCPRF